MAKYWKSRKYAKRWRRVYKRYFGRYRPRRLALGKETGHETVSGVSESAAMVTIATNASVGGQTITVTPFYHNFVGYGNVVNQPYGIAGSYGNEQLRACFARYQQVRVKGMYLRVRVESVHQVGQPIGAASYIDPESFNSSITPFVVWDRQAQLKDVDDRDFTPSEGVSQAFSQGMPMWYNHTTRVWETKCLPKDLAERACWIDTSTSFATDGSGGQGPSEWYGNATGSLKWDYMFQTNYFGNTNLSRTIPPPQFNPIARINLVASPLVFGRDCLVHVAARYILEFRNPGCAQTITVRDALLNPDTTYVPHT